DWTVAGVHQAPSAGAALVLAQIAARLLTTPAVEIQFVVTEQPVAWQRLFGLLGLAPQLAGEHRWGDRRYRVLPIASRGWLGAPPPAAGGPAAADPAPAMARPPGTRPLPVGAAAAAHTPLPIAPAAERAPGDDSGDLSAALDRRVAQLARSAALSPREHEVL